jgi:hypothetical protein
MFEATLLHYFDESFMLSFNSISCPICTLWIARPSVKYRMAERELSVCFRIHMVDTVPTFAL